MLLPPPSASGIRTPGRAPGGSRTCGRSCWQTLPRRNSCCTGPADPQWGADWQRKARFPTWHPLPAFATSPTDQRSRRKMVARATTPSDVEILASKFFPLRQQRRTEGFSCQHKGSLAGSGPASNGRTARTSACCRRPRCRCRLRCRYRSTHVPDRRKHPGDVPSSSAGRHRCLPPSHGRRVSTC